MIQTKIKITSFTIAAILLAFSLGYADGPEISAVGFYQFGGLTDENTQEGGIFTLGEALGISGAGGFGLIVNYRVGARTVLEASWDMQPTSLNLHVPDTAAQTRSVSKISDLEVHYYMIGAVYDWSKTRTRPYIGGTIGMVRLVPDKGYATETFPSFSVIVGCKRLVSKAVFLQARGRVAISKIRKGSLFFYEYTHHKETFMPQLQIGVGIGVAL